MTNEHAFQLNKKKIEFGPQTKKSEFDAICADNIFSDAYQSDDTESTLQMAEECSL